MKNIAILVAGLLAVSLFAIPLQAQERTSAQVTLKMGTLAPEDSLWMSLLKKVLNEVESKGGGIVKTVIYGNGVLGDEPEMVRKMRLDQLQEGAFTVQGIAAIAPEMSVLELPFLFESYEEIDLVREKFFPRFEKLFEQKGFILLTLQDQGMVNIYTNQPARSPKELAQQKMWVWANETVAQETFKALGINAVPLPVTEVLPGLRTGLINAVYGSSLACIAFQWFNLIKYQIALNLRYEPGVVVMTPKAWNSFSPSYRKLVRDTLSEFTPSTLETVRNYMKQFSDSLTEYGVKPITLTPEEREVFKKRTRVVWDTLAGKLYPRPLLDDIVKTLEAHRKKKTKSSSFP